MIKYKKSNKDGGKHMKYGLVLAGGGVRGAFHIGVWKALRRMNIELCAVTGTSIGAINGALVAQGEFETAMKMWRGISLNNIIKLPKGMEDKQNIFTLKSIPELAKDMRKNEGLDMSPLEDIVRGIIDEDKLRSSEIDFGIATFSLTQKKGLYKFIEDIPKGSLVDYIMASASILTVRQIEAEKLSDGGVYDNMPVSMLTQKGIKDIITVDVQGIGINRGYRGAGRNIIQIRSKKPHMGIMEFDSEGISRSIDDGYISAMTAFGKVQGNTYAFRTEDYLKARRSYGTELLSGLEKAAEIFDIDKLEIYTVHGLIERVLEEYALCRARGALKGGAFEKIKKEGDNVLLVWLIEALESGRDDFVKDILEKLGSIYDAASAIMYFKGGTI